MTKFLNISTDTTLGGSSASDEVVSSQKALKTYIDNHSGGGGAVDSVNGQTGVVVLTASDVCTAGTNISISGSSVSTSAAIVTIRRWS